MHHFLASEDSCLIVPTATMAEHLRHELARSKAPVRPSRIGTLAQFLDAWDWDIPPLAPQPLLYSLVSEALDDELRPTRFSALRESRELHAALAGWIEEMPEEIPAQVGIPFDLVSLFRHVRANLAKRGYALRNTRLREAAARIRDLSVAVPAHVVLDGFFNLQQGEIEFVDALAGRTSVTVTLPEFLGADAAKRRLEAAGFPIQRLTGPLRKPLQVKFSSTTSEREVEEVARRILGYAARGRAFRDIGVVLRSRDPYVPLLETTLARFGIPFRSYFADPLASHPAIAFMAGIVNVLRGGWDHSALLSLLRMPISGLGATPAGDQLDFELREKLPGAGRLDSCPIPLAEVVEGWRTERRSPEAWAEQLRGLRKFIAAPSVPESPANRDQIHAWRSTAAAIRAFDETLGQTASLLGSKEKIELAQFWKHVEIALAIEPLRVEDRRRDVVHVMDVFEARQWELPIVFVCGLLEKVFPQYHREDPVLGDSLRTRLGLSTAAQRQQEERFLFELAKTRATEHLILSYARLNEKGEETIPSFLLEGEGVIPCNVSARPTPSRAVSTPPSPEIRDAVLTKELARLHRKLSPSSVETYLQCPYQFFASRTLGLRQRPPAPRDRLDLLAQGQIIHAALAEWTRFPLLGAEVLGHLFEEECSRLRLPRTYRTEAVRLELQRHFEGFLAAPGLGLNWSTLVEEPFRFDLSPSLTIRGRIDRLEKDRNGRALVIDYKYSAGSKIRERVDDSEEGNLAQAGLYMLAAERALGLTPVGMLYCGLKKEVSWGGWHIPIAGLESIGSSSVPEVLRDLMDASARSATEVHDAITAGRIAVKPRDRRKCDWCDYRDACRVETMPAEVGAGAV
jgi:ATP-dependent helicase/DNAse subunit B